MRLHVMTREQDDRLGIAGIRNSLDGIEASEGLG
jgi:hypothetical protein